MSCNPWGLDRRNSLMGTVALPLCLVLSACGGGGGRRCRKHPAPPPPTPTPTPPPPPVSNAALTTIGGYSLVNSLDVQTSWLESPATRAGNYDVIGRLTVTAGERRSDFVPRTYCLANSPEHCRPTTGFGYKLSAPAGILPEGLRSLGPDTIVGSWDINPSVAYFYGNPYGDQHKLSVSA